MRERRVVHCVAMCAWVRRLWYHEPCAYLLGTQLQVSGVDGLAQARLGRGDEERIVGDMLEQFMHEPLKIYTRCASFLSAISIIAIATSIVWNLLLPLVDKK